VDGEKLNDVQKCAVFGVVAEVTCSTHWAIKRILLKIIYMDQWVYWYFIFHKAPRGSHAHFIFRKVFPIYAVCEVVCLNVENYILWF